ncbi:DUF488 domain-containing protein [Kaistella antarctica]|uniref:Uncharacterized conserved protein n=1 Tax=Kaistella antarctica TaxID=266748 RepID=A0A3S4W1L7_9FLAO|nr:DUF488 domain-containing protein [Kaistella antarctica]KEY19754.1 uroporphyrin-III methyltransferase [Kaistella antarctica]SEV98161.1 Uncharacterized conserved protein YeaO, DUF488 family [Kaistella antarctica]VEH96575.1 Uncharacterized conserved protein [Kaistella antarctica]
MKSISIKRIYDDATDKDGYRVLVDRLWPRGISKEEAKLDEWLQDIAPSTELRKWFDHQEERFPEFSKRYKAELDLKKTEIEKLKAVAEKRPITLLYSAKNEEFNQAIVVRDYFTEK